jgi:hypothetical protein
VSPAAAREYLTEYLGSTAPTAHWRTPTRRPRAHTEPFRLSTAVAGTLRSTLRSTVVSTLRSTVVSTLRSTVVSTSVRTTPVRRPRATPAAPLPLPLPHAARRRTSWPYDELLAEVARANSTLGLSRQPLSPPMARAVVDELLRAAPGGWGRIGQAESVQRRLFACLFVCLLICLFVCLFVCVLALFVCLVALFVCLFVCLSAIGSLSR